MSVYVYVDVYLYVYVYVYVPVYLEVLRDEKTRTKKGASQKNNALHGCMNLIPACSTEKHSYDVFCWDSVPVLYGKMSTKCQHFTGLVVRFTVFLRGFEKQHETNKKPTQTQQNVNILSTSVVGIFPSIGADYFLVGCPRMCPLQKLAKNNFNPQIRPLIK